MTIHKIQRIGAVLLITGSLLLVLWDLLWFLLLPIEQLETDFVAVVNNAHWTWLACTALLALFLLFYGFTAVYSRFAQKGGYTAFTAYIVLSLAFLCQMIIVSWEIFLYPLLAVTEDARFLLTDQILFYSMPFLIFQIISGLALLVGMTVFCLSAIRSGEFTIRSSSLVLAGTLLYGIGSFIFLYAAMAGIVLLAAGCIMWAQRLRHE